MDKLKIITLKEQGHSNREVARMVKCNRKTVGIYWNEYMRNKTKLGSENASIREIQEKLVSAPKYNSENRTRVKFTEEIEEKLNEILEEEAKKDKLLGNHKQHLTKKQIHEQIINAGFDIGISTVLI